MSGSTLLGEIREQPAALLRLVDGVDAFRAVAAEARSRDVSLVRMVGHGSSDNAASFGVYAFGVLAGWTALRESISLSVYYGAELDLSRSLVLALSQSGQTPDVLAYVERARAAGALTVALTNDPSSPLAAAADAVLPLAAGEERAVAATKTYTAQLAALALLAACAAGRCDDYAEGLRRTADLLDGALPELEVRARRAADALRDVERLFVIGRGAEFATAREISLKLLETCRIGAQALTATDLVHGPIAAVAAAVPVWAIATDDPSLAAVRSAIERARAAGARIVASGDAVAQVGADLRIPVPRAPLPLLSPLLSVAPGQLAAWALAGVRGLDADRPLGLSKITRAL